MKFAKKLMKLGLCLLVLLQVGGGSLCACSDTTKIEADGLGNLISVWSTAQSSGLSIVQASVCVAGIWNTTVQLSASTANAVGPVLAVAAGGHAAVAWYNEDATGLVTIMAAYYNGLTWSTPQVVSDTSEILLSTSLNIAISSGLIATATTTWKSNLAGPLLTRACSTSTGTWSLPVTISINL